MSLSDEGKFLINCKYCETDNSRWILSNLSNRISMYIKQRCSTYYNNKFKCECQKQYSLTPISKCCRVDGERKTIIPFELHTFVYMCKELCDNTLVKLSPTGETHKRVSDINDKILGRFLTMSDYENIQGIMSCF